jgi:prepilin-type N-terminal cleavage/methylation domain-containing protein
MRGYTLMELMATVAMLGLLSAMTAAGLEPLSRKFRQRQAAEATAQFLVRARQRAQESGRCHHVQVLDAGAVVAAGTPGTMLRLMRRPSAECDSATVPATLQWVDEITLPERMQVVQVSAGEVAYRPTGRLRNTPIPAQFQVGPEQLVVEAAPHGPVCTRETAAGACP